MYQSNKLKVLLIRKKKGEFAGISPLRSKTKDILHVKQLLGHKNINNTMLYTQLIHFEGDEYHVKVARTLEELKKLLAVGFEYVKDHDGFSVFRKRK